MVSKITTSPVEAVVGKNWWTSKVLWLNIVTMAIAIVMMLLDQPWIPAKYVAIATGIVLPILNMILRLITGQAIAGTPRAKKEVK